MGAMRLNNTIHGIDRTRTLPQILVKDPSTQGAATAIGQQMSKVASLIRINKIYPRIDELDEATLDILAHDLHVDWYDYTYDLEVKRAVIKNSVRIHMKLGTKYAVETATSDVYSGSTVEEWFEYGGDPYFFRMNIDITNGGITVAQQISLYEKIMFYKNCRSHLDYFNFQVNLETEVSLGGCTFYIRRLEVQPFLETEIELENIARLGGVAHSKTAIEVQPFLETDINLETTLESKGATKTSTSIEIQPYLETGINLETTLEGKGAIKTDSTIEIQPFLVKEINIKKGEEIQTGAKTDITQKIKIIERKNEK